MFSRRVDPFLHEYSNLQVFCRRIGGSSEPKSIQITFIDGEQKLIHLNDSEYRDSIHRVEVKKKGMPINAAKNSPRGYLAISHPNSRRSSSWI